MTDGLARLGWVLALAGAAAAPAAAQEHPWSGARGDAACTGVSAGPALDKEHAGMAWATWLGAPIASAPALARDTVVVGVEDGTVVALDLCTGWPRWRTAIGAPVRGTPALAAERVIAATTDGTVCACDLATGAVRWRVTLGEPIDAAPTAAGARVAIATRAGTLAALEVATGTCAWRAAIGSPIVAPPAVPGDVVCVATLGGACVGRAWSDGAPRFDTPLRAPAWTAPACLAGRAWVATADGRLHACRLTDGAPLLEVDLRAPVTAHLAASEGCVVCVTDAGACVGIDPASGRERWRWTSPGDAPFRGALAVVAGGGARPAWMVYVGVHDGDVQVLLGEESKCDAKLIRSGPEVSDGGACDAMPACHPYGCVASRPDGCVFALREPRADPRLLDALLEGIDPPPAERLAALARSATGADGDSATLALLRAGAAGRDALGAAGPRGRVAAAHLTPYLRWAEGVQQTLTEKPSRRRKFLADCLGHLDPGVAARAALRLAEETARPLEGFDPTAPMADRLAWAEAYLRGGR